MKTHPDNLKYAVVINFGSDDEEVYAVCPTLADAIMYWREQTNEGRTSVIMRRLPDGSIVPGL